MLRQSHILILIIFAFISCTKPEDQSPLFKVKNSDETGITFSNNIQPTHDLNIFTYLYFYNGGGVGAGDLNNDGLIDLVFTSNLEKNKLYLNQGGLTFKDVTEDSGFDTNGGWSNGVSIVDINQDGLLDIYISQVGEYGNIHGVNKLFVCQSIDNGLPVYKEQAAEYGLNLNVFGTQAAFVDFDLDGDLDFFQLNHSVHQNGTFGKRDNFLGKFHPLSGDRYFENIDGHFEDRTPESGIHSNALGYGLGIVSGDVNLDGKPDLYIGNDFHENDYLYINQGGGRFLDETDAYMPHTSRFSMGVDIGDINNDIFPEIVSLDMLPWDYKLVKMADGEDVFYNFNFKLQQGYNIQFSRNALQLNNGDSSFSEIAMMAGVHATDWSWSSLFTDFDNDGHKDLFISNGINKRMNDTDYMNYVSNDAIQEKISKHEFDESSELLTDLLPEVKIPNKFFRNKNGLQFEEINEFIVGNDPSFSNGAISVDLDNDGDLDLVTNNINAPAFVYENLTKGKNSIKLNFKGPERNRNAIGTKVILYTRGETQYAEKYPVRGFQSSVEAPLLFGIDSLAKADSALIIWPDNSFEIVKDLLAQNETQQFEYKPGLPTFDYTSLHKKSSGQVTFEDISERLNLKITHQENLFNEFDREALIPAMHSTPGPAMAVADVNGDGLEDLFFGSSKWTKPKVMLQQKDGTFSESIQPALAADSTFEESAATLADLNGDGSPDLLLASGGNEYYGKTPYLKPRLFLNDGRGQFTKKENALPEIFDTQSSIVCADIDADGDLDIFIGSETVSWAYGKIPQSYLLINNGNAHFIDKTPSELSHIGMVSDARWVDYDNDGDEDLILALEWGGIECFENNKGNLTRKTLNASKGWWNMVYPTDLNGDGKIDFILGNLGENSRIKASAKEPVRMYVNDIDENGRLDQIITHFMQGKEVIFADKKEFEKQMPFIRKKYNLSKDFANADFRDIFGKDKIKNAAVFEANNLDNAVLINQGNGKFEMNALPPSAQVSPIMAAADTDDGNSLIMGNFFECNIQMGRYDADYGGTLSIKNNQLVHKKLSGLKIHGQVRQILPLKVSGETYYLVARNNDALMVLKKTSE